MSLAIDDDATLAATPPRSRRAVLGDELLRDEQTNQRTKSASSGRSVSPHDAIDSAIP